jgi:thiol-disulfide isomerase/thioredoxin
MMPPLDVRSPTDVAGLMKRIRSGPLTIVLVYANWCGHCHRFMPHFDKAAQTPGRSVQVAKVNEEALNAVNAELSRNNAKPVEVSGYPSVIAVSPAAEVVGNIEAVPETAVMTNVMKNMGKRNSAPVPVPSAPKNSKAPSPSVNTVANEVNSMRMSMKNTVGNMSVPIAQTPEERILNMPEVVTETESESSSVEPVAPPNIETVSEINNESVLEQKGGSLYRSLVGAAGRVAPVAVLTGIAAATLRPRQRITRRKRSYSRQKKYAVRR